MKELIVFTCFAAAIACLVSVGGRVKLDVPQMMAATWFILGVAILRT